MLTLKVSLGTSRTLIGRMRMRMRLHAQKKKLVFRRYSPEAKIDSSHIRRRRNIGYKTFFWSNMSRFARKTQKLQRIRGEKKKFLPSPLFDARDYSDTHIHRRRKLWIPDQNYGFPEFFLSEKKKKKKKKLYFFFYFFFFEKFRNTRMPALQKFFLPCNL